jgi:hypothetical protein
MDAVTYLKTKARMTDKCNGNCDSCPLDMYGDCLDDHDPEQAVVIVEKWLSEHPPVTYASKMREVFPKFDPDEVCIKIFTDSPARCAEHPTCADCWNREYGSLGESNV